MDRRRFIKGSGLALIAVATPAGTLVLTGCDAQKTLALLIGEMSTAWNAFEAAMGKSLPASITQLFTDAQNAVTGWKSGTPVQGVVQVLTALENSLNDIQNVLPGMTPIEAAAAAIVLGTVVNIIEDIDPSAVPPTANSALNAMGRRAKAGNITVPPRKTILNGKMSPSAMEKQFRVQWESVTGKAV